MRGELDRVLTLQTGQIEDPALRQGLADHVLRDLHQTS
jgi:hypothetical protein